MKEGDGLNLSPPRILAIGGLDPSGQAGLLADVQAIQQGGGLPLAAAAALTAQGPGGVTGIQLVPPRFLFRQVADSGPPPAGSKTGMLGSAAQVRAVVRLIKEGRLPRPVVDPVLAASSGGCLLDDGGREALLELLLPLCRVIVPNLMELHALTGISPRGSSSLRDGAEALLARGAPAVLVKGGHGSGDVVQDGLFLPGRPPRKFVLSRHPFSLRGTGCRHASFLATRLAMGDTLEEAACSAQEYVKNAIQRGSFSSVTEP